MASPKPASFVVAMSIWSLNVVPFSPHACLSTTNAAPKPVMAAGAANAALLMAPRLAATPSTLEERFTAPADNPPMTVPTAPSMGTFVSNVSNRFTNRWNWLLTPRRPVAP